MSNQGDYTSPSMFFFSATFREPHFGESGPIQLRQCQSTLCIFHGTLRPQKPAPQWTNKKTPGNWSTKTLGPKKPYIQTIGFLVIIIGKLYIHDQYAKVIQKSHRNFLASSESHQ